jgi:hypothetical protein
MMEMKEVLSWLKRGGGAISIHPFCCCCMNTLLHVHTLVDSLHKLMTDSFCILFIQVTLNN